MRPERSGHAEAREHPTVREGLGREGDGHPDDRRRARAGLGPEHGAAAVVRTQGRVAGSQARAARNAPTPAATPSTARTAPAAPPAPGKQQERRERGTAPAAPAANAAGLLLPKRNGTGLLLRHREGRNPVGGIALQEVEDLVSAGVEAGRERRPRHRRLRRDGRRQRRVAAPGLERREVGKLSPRQHLLDDGRIHAVEAEDDDTPRRIGRRRAERGPAERRREPRTFSSSGLRQCTESPLPRQS